jgi:hypothetical protein
MQQLLDSSFLPIPSVGYESFPEHLDSLEILGDEVHQD